MAKHGAEQQALAAAMPFNANKPGEYGLHGALQPEAGASSEPPSPHTGAGTLKKRMNPRRRALALKPVAMDGSLSPKRVNYTGQMLTTNQGVVVADNQNSLKAGLRGPTLLEDFILREKITHFNHERIPERIVHARGSGAYGIFECYNALTKLAPFAEKGKTTPVFVKFSTVAGERARPIPRGTCAALR